MQHNQETNNLDEFNLLDSDQIFDALYQLYFVKLFKIVIQYVPCNEDAEEVLQDVFLKVWNNIDSLDLSKNVTGYLYRITRNTCLDFLKARKNTLSLESNYVQQMNLLNYHALLNDAASDILERELQVQIEKGIGQLPEKCKIVFVKSRLEGLKHKEISEELNISTKTVENHITKALKHLSFVLKEYLPFL